MRKKIEQMKNKKMQALNYKCAPTKKTSKMKEVIIKTFLS